MPTYNRAHYVGDALRQVCRQSFRDFEIIVSDDASKDDTAGAVAAVGDSRIRYSRNERNLNMPGNVNRILALARGEYIVILHDHDMFDPQLLEKMVALLDAEPTVGFVHPGVAWIDPDGGNYVALLDDSPRVRRGLDFVRGMLEQETFSCPASACGMVRRTAYERLGMKYDEAYGFVSDADTWFRLGLVADVGYLKEPLLTCRRRDAGHQYSRVNWRLNRWLVALFSANLERYCAQVGADPVPLRKRWQRNRDRFYARTLAAAAAAGDLAAFREGLQVISAELDGKSWLTSIGRVLQPVAPIHQPIVVASRALNAFRRQVTSFLK